ncbi:amino acid ABC transporter permease [Acuticoccus sp. I52.16.1]|uniref:amino acid ABC transporter permease n=1 Tax=Acuticoccus sp. I52.16.1 TaxID=2928472 RepID=UPI001FD2BEB3|nr:amino acid ABC transporter permease [Acuticoccus sp. I52.16.1]UOM34071.1 amino acid ABC transporter permease [Acuticoccus sp. I52.16.1]
MTGAEFQMLLSGAWTTIWISALAIVGGVPLGLLLGLGRVAGIPVLSQVLALYISIGRATPLVTLVLLLFVGLPVVGIDIDAVTAGVLTLLLNTATFNAEIWRSVYDAFPRGQVEAAQAVGMPRPLIFRRIMLPQMSMAALPGLMNEATLLIKASPAIAVIGIVDLTRVTDRISARTYEPLPPIIAAGVIYMLIIAGMVRLQRVLEARAAKRAA